MSNRLTPARLLIAGFAFLAIAFLTTAHEAKLFLKPYLFGFLFWSDLPLGAMGLLMTWQLAGGEWGKGARRLLEALSSTILVTAVLSVPIFIGMADVYPWMDKASLAVLHATHKKLYLNPAFFVIRSAIYFASWFVLNRYLRAWSGSSVEDLARRRKLCAGGIVWLGFSATFAAIDWQMSIEPVWYSTIYGMVFAVGECMTAFAFTLLVMGMTPVGTAALPVLSKKTLRDLGNIMLTLVILWAYLSFSQYLIIWSGNLPHEVTWFVRRTTKGWQWVSLFMIVFQFAVPFLVLLFRPMKHSVKRLAYIGAGIFVARAVDHFWMLIPGFDLKPFEVFTQCVLVWFGIGALWSAAFMKNLAKAAV